MKKFLKLVLVTVTLFSILLGFGCAKKPEPTKAVKQQEQIKKNIVQEKVIFVSSTAKPESCASCHTKDKSLNAMTKKISGHPAVQANTVAECASCHKKEGYPVLQKIIHKKHYQGEANAFVKSFQGSCVHCHKKSAGGEIFIPGLAAAGTTAVALEVAQIDKAPNGCLDCHKGIFTLPIMISKISGHAPVDFEDFNRCYTCHGKVAPNLGWVLHKKHLGNETFKKYYSNSCLNCHKPTTDNKVIVKGKK